jgi:hypothetical protein
MSAIKSDRCSMPIDRRITAPTHYHHFGDKNGLQRAVVALGVAHHAEPGTADICVVPGLFRSGLAGEDFGEQPRD